MAKKNKTILIVAGVGLAAAAVYMLTKKPATSTLPPAPGGPVVQTGNNAGNSTTSLINLAAGLLANLFGGGSSKSTNLPGLAQTATGPSSPAAGIPYINPSTPGIPITAPGSTAGDFSDDIFDWFA